MARIRSLHGAAGLLLTTAILSTTVSGCVARSALRPVQSPSEIAGTWDLLHWKCGQPYERHFRNVPRATETISVVGDTAVRETQTPRCAWRSTYHLAQSAGALVLEPIDTTCSRCEGPDDASGQSPSPAASSCPPASEVRARRELQAFLESSGTLVLGVERDGACARSYARR